ncbi:MAG: hypothetical protein IID41_03085 [Planctomycetes bacterium]|nr:hypothetical protein [Planctomycetota bacterium]
MDDVATISKLDLTPLVLTRPQVAALLQVSEDSIDNLHRTKQLVAVKCGKFLRWRLPDVKSYIDGLIPGEDA